MPQPLPRPESLNVPQALTQALALSGRIRDSQHKVYRDRACISALEDFLDRAVRSSEAKAATEMPSAS
jgi:hypothetical protein